MLLIEISKKISKTSNCLCLHGYFMRERENKKRERIKSQEINVYWNGDKYREGYACCLQLVIY